jgi:hypothetical protein
MDRNKIQSILNQERPDLVNVEREDRAGMTADSGSGVDELETASAVWKQHALKEDEAMPQSKPDSNRGITADEIGKRFARRRLGGSKLRAADSPGGEASRTGIIRTTKRRTNIPGAHEDTGGPEAKDLIIDEDLGIVGSQG